MYLQATVSYIDAATSEDDESTADVDESRDTASGVSEKTVEANPDANEAPEFAPDVDSDDAGEEPDIYRITIDENTEGEIGEDPIAATDADNDVLLYSLGATLNDQGTVDDAAIDHALFTINDRTGQISVGGDTTLDFEEESDVDGDNTYELAVIATDPSGATGRATVNIVVEDVDEKPDFGDGEETELTIGEDSSTDDNALPDEALGPPGSLSYNATDPRRRFHGNV